MNHKGPYYGFNGGHIEFHTVNKKKSKAADCIYLTANRVCQNSKAMCYMEKCFEASVCPFRVKEKDASESKQVVIEVPKTEKIVSIECSIHKNCPIYSEKFGKGKFKSFNPDTMHIEVQFGESVKKFIYPDAIFNKHLIVPKDVFPKVCKDKKEAKTVLK